MTKFETVGDVVKTSPATWKWTISNFNKYLGCSTRTRLISPSFSIKQSDGSTNWLMYLCPNGQNDDSKNFLSLFCTNLDEFDVTAISEYSILNEANGTIFKMTSTKANTFSNTGNKSWGHSKFAKHEFINDRSKGVLINNTLILECLIVIDSKHNVVENGEQDELKTDFEKLLENEKHSDVTFVIGKKKLHLHKAILASRSPVFEGMFEHDMQENQQNTVKITDIKLKIMKEMCRYIYAGKVNEIKSIAKDLLIAADKYCIEGLKNLCEKAICEQVNNDNAFEYLQLATTYNAEFLKPRVYQFVTSHMKDLYEKPEYKKLDPEIKDEIVGILIGVKSVN